MDRCCAGGARSTSGPARRRARQGVGPLEPTRRILRLDRRPGDRHVPAGRDRLVLRRRPRRCSGTSAASVRDRRRVLTGQLPAGQGRIARHRRQGRADGTRRADHRDPDRPRDQRPAGADPVADARAHHDHRDASASGRSGPKRPSHRSPRNASRCGARVGPAAEWREPSVAGPACRVGVPDVRCRTFPTHSRRTATSSRRSQHA